MNRLLKTVLLVSTFSLMSAGCEPPLLTILTPAPISEAFEVAPGLNQITASQGLVLAVECVYSYAPCRNMRVDSSASEIADTQPAFLGTVAYVDPATGEPVPSYRYTSGADTYIGEQQARTAFLLTTYAPGRTVVTVDIDDQPFELEVFVAQDAD